MPKLTARTELLYVVREDVQGELQVPSGSDALRLIEDPTFDQMIATFYSKERKNTYDYTKRFTTRYPAGKGSFQIYVKPSGTPGVAPVGDACFEGLYGRRTVTDTPWKPKVALESGTGITDGDHYYAVSFVTDDGVSDPTESNVSPVSDTITADGGATMAKVLISDIPIGGPSVTSRKIYRTKAGGTQLYFLHELADNVTTSYEDTAADGSITVKNQPAPAVALVATIASGAGVTAGVHEYAVAFITATGDTTLSPVATVTTGGGNLQVELTVIPLGDTPTTDRQLYRTKAGGSVFFQLDTLGDNSTLIYTDNTPDSSLTVPYVESGGGYVRYDPIRVSDGLPPTYSIFHTVGELVLQMSGFIFEKGTFNCSPDPSENSAVSGTFEGEFFCQHIAAPSLAASSEITTATTVDVVDASQFLNNPFIQVLKADGTTHGPYRVSAIDYVNNTLTIDTNGGFTEAITTDVDTIRGYVPVATDSGFIVNWAFGIVQEDLENIFITGAELTYQNGYKVIDNEKNGLLYPNDFMINGLREIAVGGVTFYFDAHVQGNYFYRAQKLNEKAWELPFGDQDGTAGMIGTFYLPRVQLETSPKVQSAGGNELTIVDAMIALENTGSDACFAVFR